MSDGKPHEIHLTVLPTAAKLAEMRQQEAAAAVAASVAAAPDAPKNFVDQTLVERAADSTKSPEQKVVLEKTIEAIKTVFDPEIPINIYELGLIYDVAVHPQTLAVHVKMTLTAPGCPVAGSLPLQVEQVIEAIPEVPSANVELVWDPPWSRERMSEAALLQLGMV